MDYFLRARAVEYFNSQHPSKRTIAEGETYYLRFIFCQYNYSSISLTDVFAEGDLTSTASQRNATYHSEATFLWVGPAGANLVATANDLLPISYSPAPPATTSPVTLTTITTNPPNQSEDWDTMVDADYVANTATQLGDIAEAIGVYMMPGYAGEHEMWFTNPVYAASVINAGEMYDFKKMLMRMYPLYSHEQMIFKFPTLDAALTTEAAGTSLIFNPFVSLRRLCFDDETQAHLTYNAAHPDAATDLAGGLIEMELYYSPSLSAAPQATPEDHTLILRVSFQPSDPAGTSIHSVMSTEAFGQEIKRGLTGLFYWRWASSTHSQIGTAVLPEVSITLYTKAVNRYSNNVQPVLPM